MNKPLLPDVYLNRDADSFLREWIASNKRLLLVQGPRQVGKSASVGHALSALSFGEEYGYVDFASGEASEALYASTSVSETIVEDLLFSIGASLAPGAILFLDEIQNALPKDIGDATLQKTWIEGLCASAAQADVRLVLTGSFLGLSLSGLSLYFKEHGYPVLTMRPMTLGEFALSKGFFRLEEWDEVRTLCCSRMELPLSLHRRVMDAFACYLYVGGMPASVVAFDAKKGDLFRSEKELANLTETAKSVLAQYMDIKGRESFFESMLDLFYQGLKSADKAAFNKRSFADKVTLDFIRRSEVGLLLFPPESEDLAEAKTYFSDVGVMHYLAFHGKRPEYEAKDAQTGLDVLRRYYRGESAEKTGNIGYVFEQVVASAFAQQEAEAHYLKEGDHEIEFLYGDTGLEIKSGSYDTRASLKWYVERGRLGFVLGPYRHVGRFGSLNYAPIYWVFFIKDNPGLFSTNLPEFEAAKAIDVGVLLGEWNEA